MAWLGAELLERLVLYMSFSFSPISHPSAFHHKQWDICVWRWAYISWQNTENNEKFSRKKNSNNKKKKTAYPWVLLFIKPVVLISRNQCFVFSPFHSSQQYPNALRLHIGKEPQTHVTPDKMWIWTRANLSSHLMTKRIYWSKPAVLTDLLQKKI